MKKNRKITPHDKSQWKKLDKIEEFKLSLEGSWKQKGPYIINNKGKLDYALYIGTNKRLVGIDEKGTPILESI